MDRVKRGSRVKVKKVLSGESCGRGCREWKMTVVSCEEGTLGNRGLEWNDVSRMSA